jgi:hypothetical protein
LRIDLFQKDDMNENNSELLESFKDRFFSDGGKPNSDILFERLNEEFKFLSRNKIEEIYHILQEYFKTNKTPIGQIQQLIENNIQLESQNQDFIQQIEKLKKENQMLKDQILGLNDQVQDLNQKNKALNNEISTLKNDLNKFPTIPLKQIEEFSLQNRKLTKSKIRDHSFHLQLLNDQMKHFNGQMQKQFHKSFPFEFHLGESKIDQRFPFKSSSNEGLFNRLTHQYLIHQLKDLIQIQTSSDNDSIKKPKENVLIWRSTQWSSKVEPNACISFSFISSDFTIEGYRICTNPVGRLMSFKLEGQNQAGPFIILDQRGDELMKTPFENTSLSETSFECQHKGTFQTIRLTNLSKLAHGVESLFLYSIEFFGTLPSIWPKNCSKNAN